MTEQRNDAERSLEDAYTQDLAILVGRINVTGRVSAVALENLPPTDYVEVVAEYGHDDVGFGVAILPGEAPPLSTAAVADQVRVLIEALPGHEFEGVLTRQAPARRGGAFSRICALGRTVGY